MGLDEGFLSAMLFDTAVPRLVRNSTSVFGIIWGKACAAKAFISPDRQEAFVETHVSFQRYPVNVKASLFDETHTTCAVDIPDTDMAKQ